MIIFFKNYCSVENEILLVNFSRKMALKPIGLHCTLALLPMLDFFNLIFNVYLFLRERQSVSRGWAEREGDTESEAGSRLTESDIGLEPTNREIMN